MELRDTAATIVKDPRPEASDPRFAEMTARRSLDEAAQLLLLLLGLIPFRAIPRTLRMRTMAWLQDHAQTTSPEDAR